MVQQRHNHILRANFVSLSTPYQQLSPFADRFTVVCFCTYFIYFIRRLITTKIEGTKKDWFLVKKHHKYTFQIYFKYLFVGISPPHISKTNEKKNSRYIYEIADSEITMLKDFISILYVAATNEDPSVGLSTFIVIICVIVVVVILVMGCLVYFLRVRKTRHQHSKPQESARDQEMVRSNLQKDTL